MARSDKPLRYDPLAHCHCVLCIPTCPSVCPQDPEKSDGGTYRCNIKSQHGALNANLTLNLGKFLKDNFG